jgi:hypothetical protein
VPPDTKEVIPNLVQETSYWFTYIINLRVSVISPAQTLILGEKSRGDMLYDDSPTIAPT